MRNRWWGWFVFIVLAAGARFRGVLLDAERDAWFQ